MGSTEQEIARRFAELQQRVGERRTRVLRAVGDEDRFAAGYAELVKAVGELVEYDTTIPQRLAEPARQLSERIVRWSWRGQAAVAAVMVVLVFALDMSGGWLLLLLPHLLGTLGGSFQKVDAGDHMTRRYATLAVHVVGVLVVLVTLSVISAWFIVLILFIWVPLFGSFVEDADKKKGGSR
ncbi:hypothetical protein R6L23_01050 [Streptomyces sp. SR27]|uniref:hypothetical protein n=1 Tax=Streptomyces sp. SR27 TaxID=3076630 RepID=UPI00295AC85B|nr:hypothetical protein [Streptomyces sp. SR27]MDV9186834.1 hypothetical protein [Streptomyces sp. SR27]